MPMPVHAHVPAHNAFPSRRLHAFMFQTSASNLARLAESCKNSKKSNKDKLPSQPGSRCLEAAGLAIPLALRGCTLSRNGHDETGDYESKKAATTTTRTKTKQSCRMQPTILQKLGHVGQCEQTPGSSGEIAMRCVASVSDWP